MQNKKLTKRILALFMSIVMAFSSFPINSFATETEEPYNHENELAYHQIIIDSQLDGGSVVDINVEQEYVEVYEPLSEDIIDSTGEESLLSYLATDYAEGSDVQFKILAEDGYALTSVKVEKWMSKEDLLAFKAQNPDIEFEPIQVEYVYDEETDTLSFKMPDFDIYVSASFEEVSEVSKVSKCNDGEHNYVSTTVDATCENIGFIDYTCSICSDNYIEATADMLGHNYSEEIVKESTQEETGLKVFICQTCGDSYEEVIPVDSNKIDDNVITNPVPDYSLEVEDDLSLADIYIRKLSTELFYGAEQSGSNYVWNAKESDAGHRFSFRINYAISGVDEAPVNSIRFTIPRTILKNRNGTQEDKYEMSVPSKAEVDAFLNGAGESFENDTNFGYYENGNEIIIYNFRTIPAGDNGYIELNYFTTQTTFEYVDMALQSPFTCTMTTPKDSKTATPINLKINTTAKVIESIKRYPTKYREWQDEWGTTVKPANPEKYQYLVWTITTDMEATQPYKMTIKDTLSSNLGGMTVLGYKFGGEKTFKTSNYATNQTTGYSRFDYVLTAIPLNVYGSALYWEATNKITTTIDPIDQVDPDTSASSSMKWSWSKPTFEIPTGHFNAWERADGAYRMLCMAPTLESFYFGTWQRAYNHGMRASEYTRYDLEAFNGYNCAEITNTELTGFKYASWVVGFPYPWTYDASYNNPQNPDAYGKIPVTYELINQGVYITGDNKTTSDDVALTSDDFRFDTLSYSWYMSDAILNEDTMAFEETPATNVATDILRFYGKFGNSTTWVEFASYNIGTDALVFDSNYVFEMDISNIKFRDNVDLVAYKVTTSNAHYYTEIFTVPSITLKNSTKVMNYVAGQPSIGVATVTTANVYDSSNKNIFTKTEGDTEFARISQRYSSLDKSIVAVSNNTKTKAFNISWKITQKEEMEWGSGGELQFIPQNGGTFYDLLPNGALLDLATVDVEVSYGEFLPTSSFDVKTIDNFKGTGRTMLIVKIKPTADNYVVYYDTAHPWNNITDYGNDVYNPVAYETGNNTITEGFPDNGGKYFADGSENTNAIKDFRLMSGLNEAIDDNQGQKFLYAEKIYDITAITSASSGLMKKVKSDVETDYSYETTISINDHYSYQLRYMNSHTSASKDMIFFDSLENYDYDTMRNYGTLSDWRGTLESIDVSQLKSKGINPVIYYSTIEKLDIEENYNIGDSSVWKKLTDSTDLSAVKAIAVDARKTTSGKDFILDAGESLSIILHMRAPEEAPAKTDGYAYTYNNIYIYNTVFDISDESSAKTFLIHQDYTSVKILITGGFGIEKVSSESSNIKIEDIKFRLRGTSDYGTAIDKIVETDAFGKLYFDKVEKGSYILQEYYATPDWLLDYKEYVVEIDNEGKTWIDGVEYTNDYIRIENKPRIHGDLTFYKKELGDDLMGVEGAKFRLSGTSDYGNDVLMYATSKSEGKVLFENIELGTYEMIEVEAAPNYSLNNIVYTVKVNNMGIVTIINSNEVDENGTAISLENSEWYKKTENGDIYIYNVYKYYEVALRKVDADNPAIALEGAIFSLSCVSNPSKKTVFASSDYNGKVSFRDIEAGTYILKETQAPTNVDEYGHIGGGRDYLLDNTEYIVEIDYRGNVSITGLEQEGNTGYFIVKNSRVYDKEIVITKIWDDGLTNEERISQGLIPELHLTTADLSKDSNFHSHTWGAQKIVKEATCAEHGEVLSTCTTCGKSYTIKTDKVEHNWDDGVIRTPSTCSTVGNKVLTCSVCGGTKAVDIPKTAHAFSSSTCTCTQCGLTLKYQGNIMLKGGLTSATVSSSNYDYYSPREGDSYPNYYSKIITFIPETSGTYTFYSSATVSNLTAGSSADTYGRLYDVDMNLLQYNDDSGGGMQFLMDYYCNAGQAYYLAVGFYGSAVAGTIPVTIAKKS